MKKYKIGYTQGTFDTLHYGHVNLLKNAKKFCDYLIVGVNSDELVLDYKKTNTIISDIHRLEIISAIKYVDEVILCNTLDKIIQHEMNPYDVIFIGDDWKGNSRWMKTEEDLKDIGVDLVFIPYTKGISTTKIKKELKKNYEK